MTIEETFHIFIVEVDVGQVSVFYIISNITVDPAGIKNPEIFSNILRIRGQQ
jgi:hypothetical protein